MKFPLVLPMSHCGLEMYSKYIPSCRWITPHRHPGSGSDNFRLSVVEGNGKGAQKCGSFRNQPLQAGHWTGSLIVTPRVVVPRPHWSRRHHDSSPQGVLHGRQHPQGLYRVHRGRGHLPIAQLPVGGQTLDQDDVVDGNPSLAQIEGNSVALFIFAVAHLLAFLRWCQRDR